MPESGPIKVLKRDGQWELDYGSYADGYHLARSDGSRRQRSRQDASASSRSKRRFGPPCP